MQVYTVFLFELVGQVIDDAEIEILTTEEGIPVGGQHLELVLPVDLRDLDGRNIEGSTAQVVNHDLGVAPLLVHTVGQRRSRGLIDDALYVESRDSARILGGLTLGVVEVSGHRDHRLGDLFAQVLLGRLLHFLQGFGRYLRGCKLLPFNLNPGIAVIRIDDVVGHHLDVLLNDAIGELAPDQALDRKQGVGGVGDRLTFRALAHQNLAVVSVRHD